MKSSHVHLQNDRLPTLDMIIMLHRRRERDLLEEEEDVFIHPSAQCVLPAARNGQLMYDKHNN